MVSEIIIPWERVTEEKVHRKQLYQCPFYDDTILVSWVRQNNTYGKRLVREVSGPRCVIAGKDPRLFKDDAEKCGMYFYEWVRIVKTTPPERIHRNTYLGCVIVRRFARAIVNRQWKIVYHMWLKVPTGYMMRRLIAYVEMIGFNWKTIQTNIGKWLMQECRAEPACPYKPLLPETTL